MTRPANASDVVVMIQDLDDCLALYETLGPRYFLGDKGNDRLENIQFGQRRADTGGRRPVACKGRGRATVVRRHLRGRRPADVRRRQADGVR